MAIPANGIFMTKILSTHFKLGSFWWFIAVFHSFQIYLDERKDISVISRSVKQII